MELTTDQSAFSKDLDRVRSIVPTGFSAAIHKCVRIEAFDGRLNLICINQFLNVHAWQRIETITEEGAAVVEAAPLAAFIKRLPKEKPVKIKTVGGKLEIRSGKIQAKLATSKPEYFALMSSGIETATKFELTADMARSLLLRPMPAHCSNQFRTHLCGGYLHIAGDQLRGAATNGAVLAVTTETAPLGILRMPAVTIPTKTLELLAKCLGDDPVTMMVSDNKICMMLGNLAIISTVCQGGFPNYENALKSDDADSVAFDKAEALQAVDQVGSLSGDELKALRLEPGADQITVSTSGKTINDASAVIAAEIHGSPSGRVFGFKPLRSMLAMIAGDRVALTMPGEGSHALRDQSRPNDRFVLMPLRSH